MLIGTTARTEGAATNAHSGCPMVAGLKVFIDSNFCSRQLSLVFICTQSYSPFAAMTSNFAVFAAACTVFAAAFAVLKAE